MYVIEKTEEKFKNDFVTQSEIDEYSLMSKTPVKYLEDELKEIK